MDARHKFAHPERLGQVIVRAHLQPNYPISLLASRGQHQHRHVALCPRHLANPAQDAQPVHLWQHPVEQHQVGTEGVEKLEPGLTVGCMAHGIALGLQFAAHERGEVERIFDQ